MPGGRGDAGGDARGARGRVTRGPVSLRAVGRRRHRPAAPVPRGRELPASWSSPARSRRPCSSRRRRAEAGTIGAPDGPRGRARAAVARRAGGDARRAARAARPDRSRPASLDAAARPPPAPARSPPGGRRAPPGHGRVRPVPRPRRRCSPPTGPSAVADGARRAVTCVAGRVRDARGHVRRHRTSTATAARCYLATGRADRVAGRRRPHAQRPARRDGAPVGARRARGRQRRPGVRRSTSGPPERRAWTVMGDTINLAARVMGHAPVGGVLAHESVLAAHREAFERTPVDAVRGQGQERGRCGRRSSGRGEAAALPIGRERAAPRPRGRARAAAQGARSARAGGPGRRPSSSSGEPGIGKTTLLQARARRGRRTSTSSACRPARTPRSARSGR